MTVEPDLTPLTALLARLSGSFAFLHCQLASDYEERLRAFLPMLAAAKGTPFESVAKFCSPAQLSVHTASIEIQFGFGTAITHQVEVRVLNAGFVSRFGRTNNVRHKLTAQVSGAPLQPGQPLPARSRLEDKQL